MISYNHYTMKLSSLLVFLLVLHILLCGAFGARIGKLALKPATSQHRDVEPENPVTKDGQIKEDDNNVSQEKIGVECNKDCEGDCSSKGKNRKLISSTTVSTSPAKPFQENSEHGRKKVDTKRGDKAQTIISSSSIHRTPSTAFDLDKHKKPLPRAEYESAMDMTVMDYSPAKRKPPIHN